MNLLGQKAQDADADDSKQERNLRITSVPLKIALGVGLGVVVAYGLGDSADANGLDLYAAMRFVSVTLFVAGAFFGLGLLLGFVFGVPRSTDEAATSATSDAAEGTRHRLKVNTNLEQISDWLTKILVGVGLTQLTSLPTKLWDLAGAIAPGLGGNDNDRLLAAMVILYFFVCGFFSGYLLTRLFLAGAFFVADNMSEKTVRTVQEMKGEVQSLRMEVYDNSVSPTPPLPVATTAIPGSEAIQPLVQQASTNGLPTWRTLAQQYNEVRQTQSAGESRTRVMSQLFAQMCALAAHLEEYDPKPDLQEKNGGRRLFAYAYLLARPKPELLSLLVDAVAEPEESQFGQYRGIKSIGQVLAAASPEATEAEVRRLEAFLQRLEPGTDRRYELSRILDEHRARKKKASKAS